MLSSFFLGFLTRIRSDSLLTVAQKVPINDHTISQTYVVPGPPVFKGTAAKKARDFAA